MIKSRLNVFDLIKEGVLFLKKHEINNPKKEIEWFLQKEFKFPLYKLKSNYKFFLKENQHKHYNNFLLRRSKKEPFQHILNLAPFYNSDFIVNKSVLIPRPETETIIEILKGKMFKNGLDIGTGCGNLAIVLRLENIVQQITATDISEGALDIAQKNAQVLNVKNVFFKKHNILNQTLSGKYDLIVSNPPYISKQGYNLLPKHIKNFEPKIALTDNQDGYLFYKFFANNLYKLLKPTGVIMLEIGLQCTKPTIEKIFLKNYKQKWHKDLNGDDRILQLNV